MDGLLVRELVKNPQKEEELLGTTFILRLLGTVLTWVIIFIAVYFVSDDKDANILVFIIASAIYFSL